VAQGVRLKVDRRVYRKKKLAQGACQRMSPGTKMFKLPSLYDENTAGDFSEDEFARASPCRRHFPWLNLKMQTIA
jgi:hypothetical protein